MIFWQTFAAGFLAAGTALVVNNLLLRLGPGGRPVLAFLGPLGEEALKTALSFMTGAPWPAYILFSAASKPAGSLPDLYVQAGAVI